MSKKGRTKREALKAALKAATKGKHARCLRDINEVIRKDDLMEYRMGCYVKKGEPIAEIPVRIPILWGLLRLKIKVANHIVAGVVERNPKYFELL